MKDVLFELLIVTWTIKVKETLRERKYLHIEDVKSIRVDYKISFHNYVSCNDSNYNRRFLPLSDYYLFPVLKNLWRTYAESVVMQCLNNAGKWHRLTGNKISFISKHFRTDTSVVVWTVWISSGRPVAVQLHVRCSYYSLNSEWKM